MLVHERDAVKVNQVSRALILQESSGRRRDGLKRAACETRAGHGEQRIPSPRVCITQQHNSITCSPGERKEGNQKYRVYYEGIYAQCDYDSVRRERSERFFFNRRIIKGMRLVMDQRSSFLFSLPLAAPFSHSTPLACCLLLEAPSSSFGNNSFLFSCC